MKILKYIILILILWGFPTFALFYISPAMGSATSYLTIALAMVYYILNKDKKGLMWPFIILGLTYYTLAGLNYTGVSDREFFTNFIKFILIVVCCADLARKTTLNEIYVILIFGALSVVCHSVFFANIDAHFGSNYGRFSGFYLNPNYAAIICLSGFSISYGIKNSKLKLLGQLVFSFAGLLTLSRYFFSIWILMNLLGMVKSKKNMVTPAIGVAVLVLILTFGGEGLKLNTSRFEALNSLFDSEEQVHTETINRDSRADTWATYYDIILDKPFLGNGYRKLQGRHFGLWAGVHNTYLMVIGEAGIIPFLVLIWIIGTLFIKGVFYYNSEPEYFFLNIVVVTSLLVGHTYFEKFSNIFFTLFLYARLIEFKRNESGVQKND
ncbi:O-antigen ligase family protein [Flagellimonas allohymeniacidonis]|uniref:O-antigen ligase-related domain-containing protein n=1 Tax=Flagellimonas allohymeniacidonis TaxID=2517819 RepID=A0A4Q8QDT5_9FLAO|nr:O-antigen ligase family protein [Allomuricauda hymeniacidonis]TAI48575.1 hypothetical protein EW142_01870 [Allomuricauda hymeniacidonis]